MSIFSFFLGCLLEGLLEGSGSQIGAQTIKNHFKNGSERDKSRLRKTHRFWEKNVEQKRKEINSWSIFSENVKIWKLWFFIGFYSIICMSAVCTTCRNLRKHVRGEAWKIYEKWAYIRGKKWEIYKHLSKVGTEMKIIQKTSSKADFYKFWLDFGIPRRAQKHQKWIKKQAEKTAKKTKAKKHKKT